MKQLLRFNLLTFIILAIIFGVFLPKNAYASTYTLSGNISSSVGMNIDGAEINVIETSTNTTIANATTNTEGNYTIAVNEGTYSIQVTPPAGSSFSPAIGLNQTIVSNKTLNFILVPIGQISISGHLYNTLGTPLSQQTIYLLDNSNTVISQTSTTAEGYYLFKVTAGNYKLRIEITNQDYLLNTFQYADIISNLVTYSQSQIVDFNIPAKDVVIHVQDNSNTPIVGAHVQSLSFAPISFNSFNSSSTFISWGYIGEKRLTNDSGDVHVWLPIGNSNITTNPPNGSNFMPSTSSFTINNDTQQITVNLNSPVKLIGRIFNANGDTLSGQRLYLINNVGTIIAETSTNLYGEYSLTVSPGDYKLRIEISNQNFSLDTLHYAEFITNSFAISQNQTADFTIPAKEVVVEVKDDLGNFVSGALVQARVNSPISFNGFTFPQSVTLWGFEGTPPLTDSSGRVHLLLYPGESTITITPPDGSEYLEESFTQTITEENMQQITKVIQKPVRFSGHLYTAQGLELSGQNIYLLDAATNAIITQTITNLNGEYSMSVSKGEYKLKFDISNPNLLFNTIQFGEFTSDSFQLTQDRQENLILPSKKVTFRIQDQNGNAIQGATLKALEYSSVSFNGFNFSPANAQWGYSGITPTTDSEGIADIWLYPGNSNITVIPPENGIFTTFSTNIPVLTVDEQDEIVSLQYSHATPVTTNNLATEYPDGTYSNPTTVTLSAMAADGYTVANTYFTVDNGTQQTYSAPFTVSGNTEHTITYWSADNTGVTETPKSKTFTIAERHTIAGTVYIDANQNGFQDSGENGYEGAEIVLTGDGNQTVQTNTTGEYSLANLLVGNYNLNLTVPNGYVATTSNPVSVPLTANTTVHFGIKLSSQPIGNPTQGETEDSHNWNFMNGTKFTVGPVGGMVTSMSVYIGDIDTAPNNKYQMAIYTNKIKSNGKAIPGTLIAQTANGTLTANSWNTLPITATFSPNTNYWLMYNTNETSDDLNNMYRTIGEAEIGVFAAKTFGTWPGSYPNNPTLTNQKFSIYATMIPSGTQPTILAGNTTIEASHDENAAGLAEAFKFTALTSGTAQNMAVYLSSDNAASQVRVGIYTDNNNNPGTLIAQATIPTTIEDSWNTVTFPTTTITAGTNYWIAILSPQGSGFVRFRDKATGGTSVGSQPNLTTLPATWTTNQTWTSTDLSAYLY